MNLSNFLLNHRCYICSFNILKYNKIPTYIRSYSDRVDSQEILIPNRIHRGPTDILKALATTIKRDPTAAHYKFHDDPYLIPVSNNHKRIFALSQESGRKTAMWIREKHPELFQHRLAEPPIEAFFPKVEYDETDDINNETLAKVIKNASVKDAIHVYELMLKASVEVTDENKQSLLELICFFNQAEQLAEQLFEERWFSQISTEKESVRKTWKDAGYAAQLFKELPPSSKSYSAIIQGMMKFNQMEKGNEYYQDAIKKGFILSADAHHAVLKMTNYMIQGADLRWNLIQEILHTMNEQGCKPNIRTLNTILGLLSRMSNIRDAKRYALKMIAEVKRFGVEPSLGSYHFLIKIFCGKEASRIRCYILKDILDHIQEKEITIQDTCDILFFSSAMEHCRFYLQDISVAHRLNKLLWFGNNYNLIGNSFKESAYYRNFFILLIESESLDTIMKFYNFYVPNIYTPEMMVMEELIKNVSMNGVVEYYPRIWTDIVWFDMANKERVLKLLLEGMVLNSGQLPSETAFQLGETAWSVFNKVEDATNRIQMDWTGEMLGQVMLLCLYADNYERAASIFGKLVKDGIRILGVPEIKAIEVFMDACIKKQDVKLGLACIQYCDDNGYGDVLKIAKKFVKKVHLSPANSTHLIAMLGKDVYDDKNESENVVSAANV